MKAVLLVLSILTIGNPRSHAASWVQFSGTKAPPQDTAQEWSNRRGNILDVPIDLAPQDLKGSVLRWIAPGTVQVRVERLTAPILVGGVAPDSVHPGDPIAWQITWRSGAVGREAWLLGPAVETVKVMEPYPPLSRVSEMAKFPMDDEAIPADDTRVKFSPDEGNLASVETIPDLHSVPSIASQVAQILMIILGIPVILSGYFFPSIMAKIRQHHQIGAVVVINAFLGWTLIGWVGALALAMSATEHEAIRAHSARTAA